MAASFVRRVVTVAAGCELAFDQSEWRDALVIVDRGEIELEGMSGALRRFGRGAILWLDGLPLRLLRNPGTVPADLISISRAGRAGSLSLSVDGPRQLP